MLGNSVCLIFKCAKGVCLSLMYDKEKSLPNIFPCRDGPKKEWRQGRNENMQEDYHTTETE